MPLISHRLLMDAPDSILKLVLVAWLQRRQLEAGRPHLGRSAWLWFILTVHCSAMLVTCCTFVLKSVWVSIDHLVTESGPNWTWCMPFGLNLLYLCKALNPCLVLCSGPSSRNCMMKLHSGRPVGWPGISPILAQFCSFVPEIK